jgi:hypothetical protein
MRQSAASRDETAPELPFDAPVRAFGALRITVVLVALNTVSEY